MALDVCIAAEGWQALPSDACAVAQSAFGAVAARCDDLSPEDTVSLLLDDDEAVRRLNDRFRGRDAPTNVLAFPAAPDVPFSSPDRGATPGRFLGDVVLALETVCREAAEQRKPLPHHVTHLTVHALLHLLGHDHEDPADAEIMEALETRILADLGIPDPYGEHDG
ncbi:MAG: rRNA maturation RNase YbeY [Alphaproteobacteria bacterium]